MSIVSFLFIGLVSILYILIAIADRFLKSTSAKQLCRKWILLCGSYLFVMYADIRFGLVLLLLSVSTWYCAQTGRHKIGIIVSLLALGFFKYTNFFLESFAVLFHCDFTLLNLILPIGISFYTFSAISYLMDVHQGKTAARSFLDTALYLSFFPKLTSGPIQKSEDFFQQVDNYVPVGWNRLSIGIQIFVFGLFKKIVFADRLSVFVNQVYETPLAFGSFTVFLSVIAYSFQIYFDFSGYSDMAIGIAKIYGIELPQNFNLPYLSHNVTELWKRWHITLSSWLQEYLYIPLGGNRKGALGTYRNLILTMVIGGIWHGANWTYILWGLLHGIALAMHKLWMSITDSPRQEHTQIGRLLSVCCTFFFTTFCWIFFRADSIPHAVEIIGQILRFQKGLEQPYFWLFLSLFVYIAAVTAAIRTSKHQSYSPKKKNISSVDAFYPILDLTKFWHLVVFFTVCGLLICLAYTGGSPFIYGNY